MSAHSATGASSISWHDGEESSLRDEPFEGTQNERARFAFVELELDRA